jgi:anthranilate phosphoribosyltransferase
MIREILAKLAESRDLDRDEARGALVEILRGEATPAQIAAFATALRVKGETIDEIVGCVQAMRDAMVRVHAGPDRPVVLDVVGTGGDGKGTYNISTLTALVAAACGATVAKHGNRAASSRCGSADLFEALGVRIDAPKASVERCLREIGIAFLFAPLYHPALKHASPVRKELGFRTVFNLLGPLCNPAGANAYALGVPRPDLVEKIGRVLQGLGVREAYVFHSDDGMDELSPFAPNRVCHVTPGAVETAILTQVGLKDDGGLVGGSVEQNRAAALSLLKGERGGALRAAVCLNAAVALQAAGIAASLQQGLEAAGQALDSGRALEQLEALRRMSHED